MIDEPVDPSATPRGFIADEELIALALAADPNPVIDPDAVPWPQSSSYDLQLLPDWYMPAPHARRRKPWPIAVTTLIVVGFLVIDAFGLCITSGFLSLA
jgi:hypothetical protein